MTDFRMQARVGWNEDDKWNVGVMVTNIDTKDEAVALGQALAQQFQDFIRARGGTIDHVSSPIGSEISPGLALPPGFVKRS